MAKVFKSDTWVDLTFTLTGEYEFSGTASDLAEALNVTLSDLANILRSRTYPQDKAVSRLTGIASATDETIEFDEINDEDGVIED